jgi:hypothetical protein
MRRTADDKMMKQIGCMTPGGTLAIYRLEVSGVTPDSSSTLCGEVGEVAWTLNRFKPLQALVRDGRCRSESLTNGISVETRLAVEIAIRLFHHDRYRDPLTEICGY